MPCRGIRGAIVTPANTREAILASTRELMEALIAANDVHPDDVASVFFTTSPDLTAEYPALAARELGWLDTALLCNVDIAVPTGLAHCIRVLIHWNTEKRPDEVIHCYLGEAERLRPDRARANYPA
jgi:chorismate mutase